MEGAPGREDMTVKELIWKLQAMPGEAMVVVPCVDGHGWEDAQFITHLCDSTGVRGTDSVEQIVVIDHVEVVEPPSGEHTTKERVH